MEENTYRANQTTGIASRACIISAMKSSPVSGTSRETCRITLRPTVAADSQNLLTMHQRLSRNSIYYRYLHLYTPSLQELEDICRLSPEQGQAFVAALPDDANSIVGLAYYIRDDERGNCIAEFGIVIEDGFQGISLGRAMYDHICQQARLSGVNQLEAYVHPQNKKMLGLLKRCPHPVKMTLAAGLLEIAIDLSGQNQPTPLPSSFANEGWIARPETRVCIYA